jgi:hypothetical protein
MKLQVSIISFAVAAVLIIWLALERKAVLRVSQENSGLREQLSEMGKLAVENQRLSNLVAQANNAPSTTGAPAELSAPTDGPAAELLRLRDEVQALRERHDSGSGGL